MKFDRNLIYKSSVLVFVLMTFAYIGSKEGYAIGRSLSYAFLLFSSLLFVLLFRRVFFGLFLGGVLTLSVYFVSLAKFQNMGITLNASDLLFYSQSPKDTLKIFFEYLSITALTEIFIGFLVVFAVLKIEKKFMTLKKPAYFLIWLFCLVGLMPFSHLTLKSYALYLYGSPNKLADITMNQSPSVSSFVASIGVDGILIPHFPDNKTDFNSLIEPVDPKLAIDSQALPNVFVWLEESTFDPHILKDCVFESCNSSMFTSRLDSEFFNPLKVHTWGGGTWTSEFAFLTGLDHRMFGPLGSAAPLTLAPRMNLALPKYLSQIGYETIAVYPVRKSYLNAGPAYRSYGFDQVIDIIDEGEGDTWKSTDQRLFEIFKKIVNRQNHKKPLFVFMLTIYQHGPHRSTDEKPRTQGFQTPYIKSFSKELNDKIDNYLDRMIQSEIVVKEAEQYFTHQFKDQKWIFTHFGDHQPSFDEAVSNIHLFSPEKVKYFDEIQYITYFKMKANFKLSGNHYPEVDLAYLGNYLLSMAGIPMNDFYKANEKLLELCNGKYMTCENRDVWESYNNYIFNRLQVIQN
jgi:phosphoglycerol transferase MdoB-like AlkP superfamily enzyme